MCLRNKFVDDDYPSHKVMILERESKQERERADHGYWLLIYHISPHHSRTPINIQGLEARGVDRGQAMCKRREHKDKTPRFIYAAWRFVTTLGDKCLLEARGISSVIMANINWFCNDFHLCSPDCVSVKKQSSFMMALSWLELKKNKAMRWWEALFLIHSSKWYAQASERRYFSCQFGTFTWIGSEEGWWRMFF